LVLARDLDAAACKYPVRCVLALLEKAAAAAAADNGGPAAIMMQEGDGGGGAVAQRMDTGKMERLLLAAVTICKFRALALL
jgi:hypothetical protein